MIKMKEKDGKIYIYIRDEITGIEWTTIVDKTTFEWCVKKKDEAGVEDPVESVMLDYATFGNCVIPGVTLDDVKSELQKGEEE